MSSPHLRGVVVKRGRDQRANIKRNRTGAKSLPVVLIGSNKLFQEGLKSVLTAGGRRPLVCLERLSALAKERAPSGRFVLLVDCELESEVAAIGEALAELRSGHPDIFAVLLTQFDRCGLASIARRTGANAVVGRDIDADSLVKLLDVVAERIAVLPFEEPELGPLEPNESEPDPPAAPKLVRPLISVQPGLPQPGLRAGRSLSARELAILRCLMEGEPNKRIARRLSIAEATVKIHVKGVLRKISVANRTQAAVWAHKYLDALQPAPTEAAADAAHVNGASPILPTLVVARVGETSARVAAPSAPPTI